MTIRPLFAIALVSLFGFLAACGGSTEAPVEEAAVEETAEVEGPVSGVTAFWEMYEFGFDWAADLQPLSLTSGLIADDAEAVDAAGGVATVWSAIFVSPGQREAREFTYRAVSEPGSPAGVSAGPVQPWAGPRENAEPFDTGAMVLDSEEALEKAEAEVGTVPSEPVSFYLGKETRFPAPVWAVLWGEEGTGTIVIVNAQNGEIIQP